jgi:hypothetical membrane protein
VITGSDHLKCVGYLFETGPLRMKKMTEIIAIGSMTKNGNTALRQVSAGAGIIAPIFFAVLVTVASLLRPGYSQIYDDISYLGVGPLAIIQNANFIAFGLLLVIFAIGFGRTLEDSSRSSAKSVAALLVISGLGVFFAGASLLLLEYIVHIAATFVAFSAIIVAQLFTWRLLGKAQGNTWGNYRRYSLVSGLLSLVLLFAFVYSLSTPYHGAMERVFVAVPLVWIGVSGIRLSHT